MPTPRHATLRALFIGSSLALLTACGTTSRDHPGPLDTRNGITVAESIERLELYPNPEGFSLSARDRQAMGAFLAAYARQGNGPVYVNAPTNAGPGIAHAERELRTALAQVGLAGVPVQQGSYDVEPGAPAPLVVSYRRLKTLVPRCDAGNENLVETYHNTPSANWGCAYYANIAAMVADPNQFIAPYPVAPPSMERRMDQYEKYIEGEPTAATRPEGQNISSQETGGGGGG